MNRKSPLFRCLRAGLLSCLVVALPLWAQASYPSQEKQPQSTTSDESRERDHNQKPESDSASTAHEQNQHGAMTAQSFLNHMSMANQSEVSLAKLAQQKASHQEVKDFAKQLENDHTQAQSQLQQVAQKDKVQLPQSDQPPAKENTAEQKLSSLSGEQFDKAYIQHEIRDHKKAISMAENASKSLNDPDAKQYAQTVLPQLQEHLNKAEQIGQQLGVSSTSETHNGPDKDKDKDKDKMPPK
jgi:putative membrane protein